MIKKIYTKEKFFEVLESKKLNRGLKHDKIISDKIINGGGGVVFGFCQVCKKFVYFLVDTLYSNNNRVNFRERMVCPNCGLNNRQRFLLGEALKKSKKYKNCKIYIYEQVTVCYQKIKSIYPNTIGSEYFGSEYESGTLVNGILHEDSAELSFPENSFDLILSLDVFEHVFDLEKSFKEAFRVLKPSGQMIFSVPYGSFLKGVDITQKRAEIIDGNIVYIKETQYHGNPISDKGSLVVYNIAWDCLEMLKSVGFSDIHLTAGYNRMTGNIGLLQFFFEAIKQ